MEMRRPARGMRQAGVPPAPRPRPGILPQDCPGRTGWPDRGSGEVRGLEAQGLTRTRRMILEVHDFPLYRDSSGQSGLTPRPRFTSACIPAGADNRASTMARAGCSAGCSMHQPARASIRWPPTLATPQACRCRAASTSCASRPRPTRVPASWCCRSSVSWAMARSPP